MGLQLRSSLAGIFLTWGLLWGCSHLKAKLILKDLLARWLSHRWESQDQLLAGSLSSSPRSLSTGVLAWVPSCYGSWLSSQQASKKEQWRYWDVFYDLASRVTHCHFLNTLLVQGLPSGPVVKNPCASAGWKDFTCHGATGPDCHNHWACALELVLHNKQASAVRSLHSGTSE